MVIPSFYVLVFCQKWIFERVVVGLRYVFRGILITRKNTKQREKEGWRLLSFDCFSDSAFESRIVVVNS